jgi:hypothetical protein
MPHLNYRSVKSPEAYDELLNALYMKVPTHVEEIVVPAVKIIAVGGHEPPASQDYQQAIGVLYGIGYTLKMGLKFGKLPAPKGAFDYRVGALETLWWSDEKTLCMDDPTLQWKAYLMVPAFVTARLFEEARCQAVAKHPEVSYARGALETLEEGRAIQVLHVGPYGAEQPTIALLHQHAQEHGLAISARHHEIYISDPRRTKPERLKTVIRFPVGPAA